MMQEPRMIKRHQQLNHTTMQELLDWVQSVNMDPVKVKISMVAMQYETPETSEEKAIRDQFDKQHLERQEEWERVTYKRLHEKFNATTPVVKQRIHMDSDEWRDNG